MKIIVALVWFALGFVAMPSQASIIAGPQPPPVFLPFIANAPTLNDCTQTGRPFTDAVVHGGVLVISRQDGAIFRDCKLWITVPVNPAGEGGLNALATDGRNLWAGYVNAAGRIVVADITTGTPAVIADFGAAGNKHNAAGLLYSNGVLLFGIGDNETPVAAQDDASARGKVWTINPQTGEKAITAKGFRNPWHIAQVGGAIYISDVGEVKFEEINVYARGNNYGWPCFEGSERRIFDCGYGANVTPATVPPAVLYGRDMGRGVVGVAVVNGVMVYADFAGDVRTFNHQPARRVEGLVSKLTMAGGVPVVLTFKQGISKAEVIR
jgi:hypothetical protein